MLEVGLLMNEPWSLHGDGEAVCVHWTSSSDVAQGRTDHGLVYFAIWT